MKVKLLILSVYCESVIQIFLQSRLFCFVITGKQREVPYCPFTPLGKRAGGKLPLVLAPWLYSKKYILTGTLVWWSEHSPRSRKTCVGPSGAGTISFKREEGAENISFFLPKNGQSSASISKVAMGAGLVI